MAETELDVSPSSGPTPEAASLADSPITPPQAAGDALPDKISLRDQLKANFKAAADPELKKPEPKKSDRPRDEGGKFKTDAAPVKAAPVESPKPKAEVQPEAPKALGPPPGWSTESKALYATLPDPIKQDILKRESEVSSGFKKYSDDAKRYQEIDAVLSPRRASLQQLGVQNDAQAINTLLQWEEFVRTQPVQALTALAKSRNIDLASLAQNPGQSNGQDVLQYVQPLSQQLNSVQSELQRMQQERVQSDISQFSKDKPHFDKVRNKMGQLIGAGLAQGLDDAYQQAINLDNEIREEGLKAELDKRLSTHTQEATQRSQQARKAAVSPSTRAPSAAVNVKEKRPGVRGSILSAIENLREERA